MWKTTDRTDQSTRGWCRLAPAALALLVTLPACTIETPSSPIAIGAPDDTTPGDTAPAPVGTVTTAPGSDPAPSSTALPTTAPAPTSSTTAPPVESTTEVVELTEFGGSFIDSGGGLIPWNRTILELDRRKGGVYTGHGPGAINEAGQATVTLHAVFTPRSPDATVSWNVDWNGYLAGAAGVDSRARVRITARVREMHEGLVPGSVIPGAIVLERSLLDDGIGTGLKGLTSMWLKDDDPRTEPLPPLDLAKTYGLEIEVDCSSYVGLSAGTTFCNFGSPDLPDEVLDALATTPGGLMVGPDDLGVFVRSASVQFNNVPAG